MAFVWIIFAAVGLMLLSMLLSQPITKRNPIYKMDSPANYGLDFEPVQFTSRDGIRLHGWWIPAGNSLKTIIFLHGHHGSMDPDLQYAPLFHENRYNVLMFDFRAHGRSEGKVTSVGALERLDAMAAVQFAAAKGSPKIGLLGFSMGGRAAVLAGGESVSVDAVVCDCCPARITTAVELHLNRRGVPVFLARALAYFLVFGASLRCKINLFDFEPIRQSFRLHGKPILFLQGRQDPNVRIAETLTMVHNAGSQVSLWLVDDAAHCDISNLHPQEFAKRVVDFFNSSLST